MTPTNALLLLILCGIGFIGWKLLLSERPTDGRIGDRDRKIGELESTVKQLKDEKTELSEKGKALFAQSTKLEAKMAGVEKERESLGKRVAKYEAEEERRIAKFEEMIAHQENTRKTLEDEKHRIRREDEERKARELEERDRMWNEHEVNVVNLLDELTKKKHCKFTSYTNTQLPEEFTGSLKPDFMIGFLKQYVIFDAKVSRSQDLKNYIKDAVKKTATKVKGNESIYKTIFLVVPTDAIPTLKELHYYEEGFTFYVVSPEALEPILASLKRIEDYDLAEAINPQERENIVDMLAAFNFHISTRNAHEFGMMIHGLETLAKAENTLPDLVAEALVKKAKMRNVNLATAETKDLIANPENVARQLLELVNPKPKIKIEKKPLVES